MPNKTNSVIESAYKAFVPDVRDRRNVDIAAEKIKSFLMNQTKSVKARIEISFAGSYAKNTWIKKESDIDIFVLFDSEKATCKLGELVPKDFSQEHGTRIYYRGKINGIVVEIIPLVKFKDIAGVENSIDLSILHADYIKNKLNNGLRKDIIILKQFCKANSCYGSETYVHGFSGYSLELLTIRYGGILNLFTEALSWKPGVYVDIENIYPDIGKALDTIGARGSPLILVDPTNPKRNVCGSLNTENFAKFVFAIKNFTANPSLGFFIDKDSKKEVLTLSKRRGVKLFKYKTKIIGPKDKFLSMYNKNMFKLLKELADNDILIYDCNPVYKEDEVHLFLQVANIPSAKTRRVLGPEVWLDVENFRRFLEEHKNAYIYGEFAAYDKPYNIKDFEVFINKKLKEFISSKSINKN